MANSYGGLILVGIKEQNEVERVVGAPAGTLEQIANSCQNSLEPPWGPRLLPFPFRTKTIGTCLSYAYTQTEPLGRSFSGAPPPSVSTDPLSSQGPDFGLRSGLIVPISETASWRPLSERAVKLLANALNNSPLNAALVRTNGDFGGDGFDPYDLSGFNRARRANLVWRSLKDRRNLIESVASLTLPESYGAPGSTLMLTLDVEMRPNAFKEGVGVRPEWLLSIERLHGLLSAMLETLVSDAVTDAVANLAGIDSVLVPQPPSCDFRTHVAVRSLLDVSGLRRIEGTGLSRGTELVVDPTLDLGEVDRRREQVDVWMQQIALDAGLAGMEELMPALAGQ